MSDEINHFSSIICTLFGGTVFQRLRVTFHTKINIPFDRFLFRLLQSFTRLINSIYPTWNKQREYGYTNDCHTARAFVILRSIFRYVPICLKNVNPGYTVLGKVNDVGDKHIIFSDGVILCDVGFEADVETLVCAHKSVPASASQYFQAMFTADFEKRYTKRVHIASVDSFALKLIVTYSYTLVKS